VLQGQIRITGTSGEGQQQITSHKRQQHRDSPGHNALLKKRYLSLPKPVAQKDSELVSTQVIIEPTLTFV
jgi:hypothetical protein